MHPKAKQAVQEIWRSEIKGLADKAFDVFLDTYGLKYLKAKACMQKDREELLDVLYVSGCPLAEPADDQSHRIDLLNDSASDGTHKGVSRPGWHAAHDV